MRSGILAALTLTVAALGQPKLYLKTRVIDTSQTGVARHAKGRSTQAEVRGRVHLLIQFDHAPGSDDTQALDDLGVSVLAYVHENGLIVSTTDANVLPEAGVKWVGKLDPADKISPLLMSQTDEDQSRAVVIEVHSDVDLDLARQMALNTGVVLSDNPDLAAHHLLASATPGQIEMLAGQDEVAYVFPAGPALVSGQPTVACAGALTQQGSTGQYIAQMGDGWDGPGKNPATVGYFFSDSTAQLPQDSAHSEILRALGEWAKYVKVTFTAAARADAAQTINILFARRDHGDGFPFDGAGPTLAHTFYPAPPNPEPLAGDMHFNDDQHWQIGSDTDLFSVALHEAGHALGLGHSDRPGAVMYPYYSQATGLTQDDIAAIQSLYAAQDQGGSAAAPAPTPVPQPAQPATPAVTPATPAVTPTSPTPAKPLAPTPAPPSTPAPVPLNLALSPLAASTPSESISISGTVTGGAGATVVSWRTDHGQSGTVAGASSWSAQVPLTLGPNSIAVTATDQLHSSVSRSIIVTRQPSAAAPVSIQLTYPTASGAFSTAQAQISLQGTASHTSGIRTVQWSSDRGDSGQASGTASWDTGMIHLQPGVNNLTVKATANDGSVGARTIAVSYTSDVRDRTAPSLTITSPSSVTPLINSDSVVMRGTASDNIGVTDVTWFTSTGASGHANGTESWETPAIPLIRGYNSVVIRAFDAAGNVGWRVVTITRQ